MKKIKCEMCDSFNFVKEEGLFVCQDCGMKYTLEDAKKLMVEVEGDNTTTKVEPKPNVVQTPVSQVLDQPVVNVDTYLKNAHRALEIGDYAEAEKYFNKAEELNPDCLEAVFYSSYSKAKASLFKSPITIRQNEFEIFKKTLLMIEKKYDDSKADYFEDLFRKIAKTLRGLLVSDYTYGTYYDYQKKCNVDNKHVTLTTLISVYDTVVKIFERLCKKYPHYYMFGVVRYISDGAYKTYNKAVQNVFNQNASYFFTQGYNFYYQQNKDVKDEIDAQITAENANILKLDGEIRKLPEYEIHQEAVDKLSKLKSDLDDLSIFKMKERKSLKTQIDELEKNEIPLLESKLNTAKMDFIRQIGESKSNVKKLEELLKDKVRYTIRL